MRRVKRTAVNIKPKQPYIDWANSLDPAGVKIGTAFTPEGRVYLIEDVPDGLLDVPAMVEPYYGAIWEEELGAWHRQEGIGRSGVISQPLVLRSNCTAWYST